MKKSKLKLWHHLLALTIAPISIMILFIICVAIELIVESAPRYYRDLTILGILSFFITFIIYFVTINELKNR